MALHLQHAPHLRQRYLLPVAQANNLIECAEQIESIFEDFPFLCISAHVRHDAGNQMQSFYVLENIRGFVRNQEDVEFLQWLVNISNFCGFDRRVLGVRRDEFWKGGQEGFDPWPRHVSELSRNHGCRCKINVEIVCSRLDFWRCGVTFSAFRAYRGGENNLGVDPRYYCRDPRVVLCTPLLILDVKRSQLCLVVSEACG